MFVALGYGVQSMYVIYPSVPSGSPLNVLVAERSSSSLTLVWEEPSSELRNGIITSYFGILTELPDLVHVTNITTSTAGVEIGELSPHTDYVFQVAAINRIGTGPFSATNFISTAEDGEYPELSIIKLLELDIKS